LTYALAILTLIFTASRISFGAFIASITLFGVYTRKWKLLIGTILLTSILMYTNSDMTQRFRDMFQQRQVFENTRTGEEIINQDESKQALPAGSQFIRSGTGSSISTNSKALNDYKQELIRKEIDEARKGGRVISQQEAADIVAQKYLNDFKDVVVKNVVAGDTSLATRTQVEWPRAWNAFLSNPLLGTGPSSITESTDGDIFRWLGETGLLGAGLFVFILAHLFIHIYKHVLNTRSHDKYLFIGICAGMIALLINATLIDVFEASKVAFTFWTVMGLIIATIDRETRRTVSHI
jgi:O-antigen ligase